MKKLKDYVTAGEFEIVDNWNHQHIEDLPRDEAIAKYGECNVCGSYTSAISKLPDGNGNTPSWKVAVWLDIPGMKIGRWNSENLHLLFIGNDEEATFIGKSGLLITVWKHGKDDYGAWWRDATERDKDTAGYSVRGRAFHIIDELEGEI